MRIDIDQDPGLIEFLTNQEFVHADPTILSWGNSDDGRAIEEDNLKPSNLFEGNLVISKCKTKKKIIFSEKSLIEEVEDDIVYHKPILDIDIPAYFVPSSTSDHSHLYLDIELSEEKMDKLVNVLAEVGILNRGVKELQWDKNKHLALRPPWTKKGDERSLLELQDENSKPHLEKAKGNDAVIAQGEW